MNNVKDNVDRFLKVSSFLFHPYLVRKYYPENYSLRGGIKSKILGALEKFFIYLGSWSELYRGCVRLPSPVAPRLWRIDDHRPK